MRDGGGPCKLLKFAPKERRAYPLSIMIGTMNLSPTTCVGGGGYYFAPAISFGYYIMGFWYLTFIISPDPTQRFDGSQSWSQRWFFGSRYDKPADWVRVLPLGA